MKNIKHLIWILAAGVLLNFSCTGDKGNYDYTGIIEITMPELPQGYEKEQLDLLEIKPDWDFPSPRTISDFEYHWLVEGIDGSESQMPDTIAQGHNLNYIVDLALGNYIVHCFVTDKIDGRVYSTATTLSVSNISASGMMVLSNVDGYASVTFINSYGNVQSDIYTTRNGLPAGKNPTHIRYAGPNRNDFMNFASHEYTIFILCDDDHGGVVCEPFLFTHIYNVEDMFVIRPEVIKPQFFFSPSMGDPEMIVNNNRLHIRQTNEQYPLFRLDGTIYPDYEIFPYICFSSISVMLAYCKNEQRFIYFTGYYDDPTRAYFKSESYESDVAFNPGNVIGMEMIYAVLLDEGSFGDTCPYRCIFQDSNGKRYLYAANLSGTSVAENGFTPLFISDLSIHPELDGAETFTFSRNGVHMFAGSGDKIYTFGAEGNSLFHTLQLDLQPGEYIEFIEIEQKSTNIYAGVSDGSRTAGSGSVYVMSANSTTGELTVIETYRNIAGSIVDFDYKKL